MPNGRTGPAFLLLKNFRVIKRYNNANSYALAVGHLADRLRGGGPFVGQWPEHEKPLSIEEGERLQAALTTAGLLRAATIDGNLGSGSRAGDPRLSSGSLGLTPMAWPRATCCGVSRRRTRIGHGSSRTACLGLFLVALALVVAVPADFGVAQSRRRPTLARDGASPPPQRRGGFFEMSVRPVGSCNRSGPSSGSRSSVRFLEINRHRVRYARASRRW